MIDIENAERFILFALIKCGRGAFFDWADFREKATERSSKEALGICSLPNAGLGHPEGTLLWQPRSLYLPRKVRTTGISTPAFPASSLN